MPEQHDFDEHHFKFARSSGLPSDYFTKAPCIIGRACRAEIVLVILAIAVIVWAFTPWGHV